MTKLERLWRLVRMPLIYIFGAGMLLLNGAYALLVLAGMIVWVVQGFIGAFRWLFL